MRSARATNQPQQAMLRGLITDPHGRPMVPTYGSSKAKRYAYYETHKDLARPGDPPGMASSVQCIGMKIWPVATSSLMLTRATALPQALVTSARAPARSPAAAASTG